MLIEPGKRRGTVSVPISKSHLHRILIADFLAGGEEYLKSDAKDSEDIAATRRCLKALAEDEAEPVLDCGESGSTRRFLAPIAAALGKRPQFVTAGRLSARPMLEYEDLHGGIHELRGDVSSQFVTALLFALPLLKENSLIRFTTPLESVGYVDLTIKTLLDYGVEIGKVGSGYDIRGSQRYVRPNELPKAEYDWSSAAFWVVMNALGSKIDIASPLAFDSVQPDRAIVKLVEKVMGKHGEEIDVSNCPDIFPELAVLAAAQLTRTRFIGTRRLRLKESDRAQAMAEVLVKLGARVKNDENEMIVEGVNGLFRGGRFHSFDDHRIAMALVVAATHADSKMEIDNLDCTRKSYPNFIDNFSRLILI